MTTAFPDFGSAVPELPVAVRAPAVRSPRGIEGAGERAVGDGAEFVLQGKADGDYTVARRAVDAGSGVSSAAGSVDGAGTATGTQLDLFFFGAGLHSVSVNAIDNLGNSADRASQFRVRATSASLLSNIARARDLGLITDPKLFTGLNDKPNAAVKAHARGQHPTEWNQLSAFVDQLMSQRGKGIDALTADRFSGYAPDLISAKG